MNDISGAVGSGFLMFASYDITLFDIASAPAGHCSLKRSIDCVMHWYNENSVALSALKCVETPYKRDGGVLLHDYFLNGSDLRGWTNSGGVLGVVTTSLGAQEHFLQLDQIPPGVYIRIVKGH